LYNSLQGNAQTKKTLRPSATSPMADEEIASGWKEHPALATTRDAGGTMSPTGCGGDDAEHRHHENGRRERRLLTCTPGTARQGKCAPNAVRCKCRRKECSSQRHATQEVRCPLRDVAVTTQSIVTMKKSCGFRGGTREAGEEIANLHHWHCPPRQVCTERSAVRVSQWRGEMRNQCHAESVTYELRRQESPDSCFGRGKNVSG